MWEGDNLNGRMIEQIRTGRTSRLLRARELVFQIWTRSADHHTGPRPLEAPHHEGLTEDRTRSRTYQAETSCTEGGNHRRKPRMLVAIALANKMARQIWAMLTKEQDYQEPAAVA